MEPLTYKSRYLSLLILFIVFIIIAPILITHSLGYRISDIGDSLFVKTGGLYVNSSNLSDTQVFIDGEFVKNGGLFVRNTFIADLYPNKEYQILVTKDDYNDYVKDLKIYPSLVTEMKVLMLPKEIEENQIPIYVQGVDINKNSTQIESLYNPDYIKTLELFDLSSLVFGKEKEIIVEKNSISDSVEEEIIKAKEIPEYFFDLGIEDPEILENLINQSNQVAWLEDGNIKTFWIGDDQSVPYYYCQEIYVCGEGLQLDWDDEILAFGFLPNREDVWVVMTEKGLYAVELDKRGERNIQPIYLGQDMDFRINSNNKIVIKYEKIDLKIETETDSQKTTTSRADKKDIDLPDFKELVF